MANLSVDFAFEGFRVIRSKPLLIPFWGVFLLIFYAAFFYLMATMMAPMLAQLQTMGSSANADPAAVLGMYQRLLPMYAILIPLALIFGAVINCAVYRAVLGSKSDSFGYLRFGGDELRQIGVNLLFFLVCMGAELVVGLVFGLVAGLGAVAAPKASILILAVLVLLLIGLVVWAGVRISLYSVQTFETRKINLFGSWKLTKGHFWVLLGGYLIMFVMAMVVELLFMVIFSAVGGLTSSFVHTAPVSNDPTAAFNAIFANPVTLVTSALFIVLLAPLMIAIMIAPVAAAYRSLSGVSAKGAEKVF